MITFLTILYGVIVVVVFKVFKVPPRPWPIVITVTVGVVMLGGIVILWTVAAPMTAK